MNLAAHTPIEIKSDPEDTEADLVTKALDDFRGAVDERLAALETKSANDNKLDARMKAVETRLNRPGVGIKTKSANDNGEMERKAFTSFLRKGADQMDMEERKTLTVANEPSAGYLAPAQYGNEILKLLTQYSPIRSYAKVVQIGAWSVTYPRRTSLATVTWEDEIEPATATNLAYEQVPIVARKMRTFVDISNQLLEDALYDIQGEITDQFADAFAIAEGAAFINGDGVKKPVGILVSPQVASFPSAVTGKVSVADLIALFHSIPTYHSQNGAWAMNRNTLGSLRGITDANGRPLLLDGLVPGAPTSILGRPVIEMLDMPDVAAGSTPIIFGNFAGYRIVDRIGYSFLRDPFTQGLNDITRFYARKRVGADITNPDMLKKLVLTKAS